MPSGALLNLAFAPYQQWYVALVALVPLFYAIESLPSGRVFIAGLVYGVSFFAGHLWWLFRLVVPVTQVSRLLLDFGVVLLFGYLGLQVGLFALLTRRLGLLLGPFCWAGLEWLRSQGEIGFPWGLLGSGLTAAVPLIQIASLIGVYGVSAFLVGVNLLVYKALFSRSRQLYMGLLALTLLSSATYGYIRTSLPSRAPAATGQTLVGIIQPNVSPFDKGHPSVRDSIWDAMLQWAGQAIDRGARLLLFPETASLVDLRTPSRLRVGLQRLADSTQTLIVIGTPVYHASGGYGNGCTVLIPGGGLGPLYLKTHLTPFSEHFPYVHKVPVFRRIMTADMGDAQPGKELVVFRIAGLEFCTPICFEGIFPELVRQFVVRGARAIMVITNDGWFGSTPGPYQHCELMVMRAVENGVPLLRSANNGISLFADSYGRIRSKTSLFAVAELTDVLPPALPMTPFVRYGYWFAPISGLLVTLVAFSRVVLGRARRR
ncbi:MAG: apolipoprotein N-acyltransferase [candidate division WOR-3 bacterium]